MTHKQKRFIDAFVACYNATEAARRAGYRDAKNEGYRLLHHAAIRTEIARLYRESCMPAEEALARLSDQARGIGGYVRTLTGKDVWIDIDAMISDGKAHLVKSARYTKYGLLVEFYDAQAALVHIGRHYKLFTDTLAVAQSRPDVRIASELEKLEVLLRRDES